MSTRLRTIETEAHHDLFVTGMMRSGTTVANRICEIAFRRTMLYQPCMATMVEVKRRFLRSIGIDGETYPLGTLFGDTRQRHMDFARWLGAYLSPSGDSVGSTSFTESLTRSWRRIAEASMVEPMGAKEILCEEFARHLACTGVYPLIVVRDPRDMIASAISEGGRRFAGDVRPLLFMLHLWRKSVALAIDLERADLGGTVIYERLARSPWTEMSRLAQMSGGRLRIAVSEEEFLRDLEDLGANSSHHRLRGLSTRSIGTFVDRLPTTVVEYVEAVCGPEMSVLGMQFHCRHRDPMSVIGSFQEPWSVSHPSVPADYSTSPRLIELEERRIDRIRHRDCSEAEVHELFICDAAKEALFATDLS